MNEDMKVFGLFGYPLLHSLSPVMHNAALRALGIPGIYFAFERDRKHFLNLLCSKKKMILDGFNVTIPYKEVILPFLDALDSSAKMAGAVNTVQKIGKRWTGYNTDIDGFRAGLKEAKFQSKGKRAVILGAGGAARAVLVALAFDGIRSVDIFDVATQKADLFVREFRKKFPRVRLEKLQNFGALKDESQTADLLVNATGVGLKRENPSVIPISFLPKKRMLVYDLIYALKETRLLHEAKQLGHRVINGETMLLHQGARAFEIWTKKKAPVSVMRKVLQDALCV